MANMPQIFWDGLSSDIWFHYAHKFLSIRLTNKVIIFMLVSRK